MTREQIIEWGKRHGWALDKFGHLRKTFGNGEQFRLKLQDNSLRRERRIHFPASKYSPARSEWMRVSGGYYKDASLTAEDKLSFKKAETGPAAHEGR